MDQLYLKRRSRGDILRPGKKGYFQDEITTEMLRVLDKIGIDKITEL